MIYRSLFLKQTFNVLQQKHVFSFREDFPLGSPFVWPRKVFLNFQSLKNKTYVF